MGIILEVGLILAFLVLALGLLTNGRFFSVLFNRAANAGHKLTEALSSEIAEAEQDIMNKKGALRILNDLLHNTRTERNTLQADLTRADELIAAYERVATEAGADGNRVDVIAAIKSKKAIEARKVQLQEILEKYETSISQLEDDVAESRGVVESDELALVNLKRQIKLNEVQEQVAQTQLMGLVSEPGQSVTEKHLVRASAQAKALQQASPKDLLKKYKDSQPDVEEVEIVRYLQVNT
jgi:chromosome segregation ATPase